MREGARSRYVWLAVWTAIWVAIVLFVLAGPEDVERCRAAAGGNEAKYCGFGTMILLVVVGLAVLVIWAPVALILLVVARREPSVTLRCPDCRAEIRPGAATCRNCGCELRAPTARTDSG